MKTLDKKGKNSSERRISSELKSHGGGCGVLGSIKRKNNIWGSIQFLIVRAKDVVHKENDEQ